MARQQTASDNDELSHGCIEQIRSSQGGSGLSLDPGTGRGTANAALASMPLSRGDAEDHLSNSDRP
jgi:hypothetical protein